jgi:hypothetical protein
MAEVYREILESTLKHLQSLAGHVFDLLTISKPISPGYSLETTFDKGNVVRVEIVGSR